MTPNPKKLSKNRPVPWGQTSGTAEGGRAHEVRELGGDNQDGRQFFASTPPTRTTTAVNAQVANAALAEGAVAETAVAEFTVTDPDAAPFTRNRSPPRNKPQSFTNLLHRDLSPCRSH